jgi:hypothetical protein
MSPSGSPRISSSTYPLIDEWTPLHLTLVILLLRPPGEGVLRGITWLVPALALALPPLARSSLTWLLLAALVFARVAIDWPLADNHIYLLGYWCLGVSSCLAVPPRSSTNAIAAMAAMSRWLVGCTFLCAIVWKGVLAPDFLDGRFFRVTLLTDDRFADLARAAGGLSDAQLRINRAALEPLPSGADSLDGPILVEPPALRRLGLVLTWGGVALEAALAWAFLSAWPAALHRGRHLLLAGFALVTYAAAPVAGFGWLLAAMGLAQCEPHQRALRLLYVAVFAVVTIYAETPLVHALLDAMGSMNAPLP